MKLKKIKKEITEKQIENYLVKKIKALGGIAYKFTSPARRAVPDRFCILPGGRIFFVECKRPGQTLTPAQASEIHKLRELGQRVHWADSYESIDEVISIETT